MRSETIKVECAADGRQTRTERDRPETASQSLTRRRSNRAVVVLAFALLAVAGLPSVARAQGTEIVNLPYADVQENPCIPGEFVTLTGRTVVAVYTRSDKSGGQHMTFRVITKAQGVSATPIQKKYVLNDENISTFNLPSSGTAEFTVIINHLLIRQGGLTSGDISLGGEDDYRLKSTFHFTVANGVPTATVDRQRENCAGEPLSPTGGMLP